AELKKNSDELALAKTNNSFIEKRDRLEREKGELEKRKAEIDETILLLEKQKKATRKVNPSYVAWTKKCGEVSLSQKQIKEAESNLETAVAAARQAKDAFDGTKQQEPEVDRLKQTISRIDDEEPKYQQKQELAGTLRELEERDKNIEAEAAELKECEKSLKEKINAYTKTVRELKGKPVELTEAKNESEKLKELLTDIDAISDDQIPEREKRKKALSKKQKAFIDARYKYEEASGRREEAERVLEDSRAGILARRLVEGEKCPVCGSVHHPEPAMVKEASISEDDFKKLQEEESELLEKKNNAHMQAEKAKTSLEEFDGQLRMTILDRIANALPDVDMEGKTLEELIEVVKEAKKSVEAMSKENIRTCNSLDKECKTLRKAEKALEAAQGDETEKLNLKKEELDENKHKIRQELTATRAILKTLEKLSFPDWETAEEERKRAETKKNKILDDIARAEAEKEKADNNVSAVRSALKTLRGSLEQQAKDEEDLRKKLEEEVSANGFSSVEEALKCV
ncbi:hypothetical protein, partial [Turicimonas muris]|uniref:hypothetical protein n=1 Tax=Turicimonas muris TaxID=1796652 RepID=UPI0024BA04B8